MVVAIIGILVSLAFPVISTVRESAKTAAARADMQSIENAVDEYYATYRKLPVPAYDKKIFFWPASRSAGVAPEDAYVEGKWVVVRCYGPNRKEDISLDAEDYDDIYSIDTRQWEEVAK